MSYETSTRREHTFFFTMIEAQKHTQSQRQG